MKRRTFLAGGAAMARPWLASATDPIGAGVIGVGGRGQFLTRQALEVPGVKIVALCDLKPERRDKAATLAARDAPATETDYHRLLERKDVQAVFIATPCDKHAEMAIAALQAGKHVYCEKPVGITPESIGELLKVARAARTVFQVGLQTRSNKRVAAVAGHIRDGAVGKVIMVKAQRHAADDLSHDGTSADWFFDARRSGDVIVEMAVHNLDACNWLIGSRPARAGGFGGALKWANDPPGRTNMDGYTLSYEYVNGVKMSFTQVFFHPRGLPGGGAFTYVYGTDGAVELETATVYPLARGGEPRKLVELPPQPERPDLAHVTAFFDSVRGARKPPADIEIGATAALTAILGREAIYRGKVLS